MAEETAPDLLELTTLIVTAFLEKNHVPASELPATISSVYGALSGVSGPAPAEPAEKAQAPAVPVKKSVTPDFIVCLEDGKKQKSLKRHLQSAHGLSPDQYREKWGLARDYPMVAPNYAQARSALAKNMGLGRGGRKAAAAPAAESAPKGRGRAKKG